MRLLCQNTLANYAPVVVNKLRTVGHCSGSEVKMYKYCSVFCTDRLFCVLRPQCIVTSHRVNLVLCVYGFLTLKAMGPIDFQ